jgi:hypothetical protein
VAPAARGCRHAAPLAGARREALRADEEARRGSPRPARAGRRPGERIDSAEENVSRLFALRDVADAILALPDPYRTTILLRFMEELDTKAVAERTGTTEGNVRVRVSRALVLLRRRLGSRYANGWRAALTALAAAPIRAFTHPLNLAFVMNLTALASLLVLTWEIVSSPALWRGPMRRIPRRGRRGASRAAPPRGQSRSGLPRCPASASPFRCSTAR